MTNNQIEPNQEPNELSDDELASVSGGEAIGELIDASKDFFSDVYQSGKELISDIGDTLDKHI